MHADAKMEEKQTRTTPKDRHKAVANVDKSRGATTADAVGFKYSQWPRRSGAHRLGRTSVFPRYVIAFMMFAVVVASSDGGEMSAQGASNMQELKRPTSSFLSCSFAIGS